ncbi:MAG: CBS domain-containing protein [Nitrospina sp.]|jgi:signal-transduction protein with cAMP-binding, CBS, and nucleotidyltransferase domain|nr:CBS domain-containing protein [Nitrospina sp.]MBT5633910.1 CBS domain-containing protein [Nitrospina sp.]
MNKLKEEVKDKVKHFITPPLIQISATLSVFEACKRMKKQKVGSILVTEGKHFVGIFTESDLLKKVVAQNEFPGSTTIFKVMTKELVYIDSESSMVAAFLKMQTKNIRHLIVKDNNMVTGVLSIKDIAKFYVHKFSKDGTTSI